MVRGLGLDLADISRIRESFERFGRRFAEKILTPEELSRMPETDPVPYLAGRFAAKEAAAKALGTGIAQGVTFHNVEVLNAAGGQPVLSLSGKALLRASHLGASVFHVSITHSRDTAAAVVVLEG